MRSLTWNIAAPRIRGLLLFLSLLVAGIFTIWLTGKYAPFFQPFTCWPIKFSTTTGNCAQCTWLVLQYRDHATDSGNRGLPFFFSTFAETKEDGLLLCRCGQPSCLVYAHAGDDVMPWKADFVATGAILKGSYYISNSRVWAKLKLHEMNRAVILG